MNNEEYVCKNNANVTKKACSSTVCQAAKKSARAKKIEIIGKKRIRRKKVVICIAKHHLDTL